MPRANPVQQTTFEEYLELEDRAEVRHEFVDGFMFAMAGGTSDHNRIGGNIYRRVADAAEDADCDVFFADMKLVTPSRKSYYPDVFVTCEPREGKAKYKRSACWIVEVLSDSTESIDRGEKLHNYRAIPSLKAYVLVSQDQKLVEIYSRLDDNSWRYETFEPADNKPLELPCINRPLSLDEIYKGVEF
ncbi:MAG: Uma2 family endonuclease [Meiothermus sp.]|nr:Uma2 family endonuclease [Meiothermus sp.]